MNKERRERILKVREILEEQMGEIQLLTEEEQGAFDNLPESLQNGERGDAMQAAIDNLESAADSIGESLDQLDEACNA